MELDELETWQQQQRDKAQRAKRRAADATREPGHLRAWYARQDWPRPDAATFNQLKRAMRGSCHAGCCRMASYLNRADRRQSRHQTRMALATGYAAYRRKSSRVSEAGYKGT